MSLFKDSKGHWRTSSLFYETSPAPHDDALYTLKDADHKGYRSLKRLYLQMQDPTEANFADEYLGGWTHWEHMLTKNQWFLPYVEEWRKALRAKLASIGVSYMINEVVNEGKSAMQAARFLVNNGWLEGTQAKRGRPSKEEVKGELKKQTQDQEGTVLEFSRIQEYLKDKG